MNYELHEKQNGTLKALYVAILEGTFHEINCLLFSDICYGK